MWYIALKLLPERHCLACGVAMKYSDPYVTQTQRDRWYYVLQGPGRLFACGYCGHSMIEEGDGLKELIPKHWERAHQVENGEWVKEVHRRAEELFRLRNWWG